MLAKRLHRRRVRQLREDYGLETRRTFDALIVGYRCRCVAASRRSDRNRGGWQPGHRRHAPARQAPAHLAALDGRRDRVRLPGRKSKRASLEYVRRELEALSAASRASRSSRALHAVPRANVNPTHLRRRAGRRRADCARSALCECWQRPSASTSSGLRCFRCVHRAVNLRDRGFNIHCGSITQASVEIRLRSRVKALEIRSRCPSGGAPGPSHFPRLGLE